MSLGRVPSPFDRRDALHTMKMRSPVSIPTPRYRYWTAGPVLDQGDTPHCVGHAWYGWELASPVRLSAGQFNAARGHDIYNECKKIDGYSGDGTYIRSGAEVERAQFRLAEYLWAFTLDDLKAWLLLRGPVVIGIPWLERMFYPDAKSVIKPDGAEVGGHAVMLRGYGRARDQFRIVNSWGNWWGENGQAWIGANDLWSLIERGGEACTSVELKR